MKETIFRPQVGVYYLVVETTESGHEPEHIFVLRDKLFSPKVKDNSDSLHISGLLLSKTKKPSNKDGFALSTFSSEVGLPHFIVSVRGYGEFGVPAGCGDNIIVRFSAFIKAFPGGLLPNTTFFIILCIGLCFNI